MANTYTWKIEVPPQSIAQQMSVDGQTLHDVYTSLHWRLTGTDGTYVADRYGEQPLKPPFPTSFVASPVPNETVVGWLTAALGADQIAALKALVDADIAAQAATVANPPPDIAPITAAA